MAPRSSASNWHISSIQVKAFKSCGPNWTTFQVPSAQLVGVVGPNGCGKSNLLEAICFATAASTSALRLAGRSLRDVTSTDAGSQLPEVRLTLQHGKAEQHVIEARLTPEGGRSYKVDGRNRTGTQVKELLKSCGMVVDSTTVIQQAAMTRLSDANNATALADLVSAASGLNSWHQETATAAQEVARTRTALKDIQANISKVQASVAADDAAMQAAVQAEGLEQSMEQQLSQLLVGLRQRQVQLQQQLEQAQQNEQQLQAPCAVATEQLQQLQSRHKHLKTQAAQALAALEQGVHDGLDCKAADINGSSSGGSIKPSASSLSQRIAVVEAQIARLHAAAASRAALEAELQASRQQLQQHESLIEHLQRSLETKQQEAVELSSNLAAMTANKDAAAALHQQAAEAKRQAAAAAAAVLQQQAEVTFKQADVQQMQERLVDVQEQWEAAATAAASTAASHDTRPARATAAAADAPAALADADRPVASAAAAAHAAAAAAATAQQRVVSAQQELAKQQWSCEAAAGPLTPPATASLLASLGSTCEAQPLHACFRIKPTTQRSSTATGAAASLAAASTEQLLVPLSVVAGPAVLHTLVVPSVAQVNRLLAAAAAPRGGGGNSRGGNSRGGSAAAAGHSHRLKIWPLDNLSVHNTQHAQRAAQQQLGQHAVMLPQDLLEYPAAHEPALLRAFGGFVIAADDATAAALVERFGLSAVTLQGTVSRKGTMSGGWTGGSGGHARALWTAKLKHDTAAASVAACEQQLAAAQQQRQQLDVARFEAEQQLAAAQQRQRLCKELQEVAAAHATAAALLQQHEQLLGELQSRHSGCQQRAAQFKSAMQDGQQQSQGASSGRSTAAAAKMQVQLKAAAKQAAAAVTAAEQQLEAARDQVEGLAATGEALECRLAALKPPQEQEQLLRACMQQLKQLKQQHEAHEAAAAERQQRLQELDERAQQLEAQVAAAERHQCLLQEQAADAAAAAKGAAAALKAASKELARVQAEFADCDAVQHFSRGLQAAATVAPAAAASMAAAAAGAAAAVCDDGAGGTEVTTAAAGSRAAAPAALTEAQLQQLLKAVKQLQVKLRRLEVPDLLPGQKEACAARLAQVAAFRQQADGLRESAAALETLISSSTQQVHAANDAVFEDVAAGFTQLCASLLPSLELQLVRTASLAHEGLQFRFRRLQDATAAAEFILPGGPASSSVGSAAVHDADEDGDHDSQDDCWHTHLGQLSGGQRTLVSLAMLLAVARTGGSGCGLLLLDEVDAALDEHNQARAAALLHQLAHDASSACQVLCVTHNAGFQGCCDGFVRVTKSARGFTVPVGQEEGEDAGAGAGAGVGSAAATAGVQGKAGGRGKQGGTKQQSLGQGGAASKKARLGAAAASTAAGAVGSLQQLMGSGAVGRPSQAVEDSHAAGAAAAAAGMRTGSRAANKRVRFAGL